MIRTKENGEVKKRLCYTLMFTAAIFTIARK